MNNRQKLSSILIHQKKKKLKCVYLRMYKMYLISAEGYKNAEVDAKIVRKTGEILGKHERCEKWYGR